MNKKFKSEDELFYEKENWPESLVQRLDAAYGSMAATIRSAMGLSAAGDEPFYWGLLDKRMKYLVRSAVDGNPQLFQFYDEICDVKEYRRKHADELGPGQSFGIELDNYRLGLLEDEWQNVHEFAVQYIRDLHADGSPADTETDMGKRTPAKKKPPGRPVKYDPDIWLPRYGQWLKDRNKGYTMEQSIARNKWGEIEYATAALKAMAAKKSREKNQNQPAHKPTKKKKNKKEGNS